MVGAGSCPQGPGCISIYGKCGYAKIRNGDKIGEKSEKIGDGWVMMLAVFASGSKAHFHIWKVWLCKMKNGDKIEENSEKNR
jgi:hypothetical protein